MTAAMWVALGELLASRARGHGWVPVATLSYLTGQSVRASHRTAFGLERRGYIEKRRTRDGTEYRITAAGTEIWRAKA